MRPLLLAALLLTPLLAPSEPRSEPTPSRPTQGGIEWREDLSAAEALALATRRPLLVVFRCKP